ncbi:MAG: GNAT family N-acetyltransferase [Armatimonadota bacterium]
MRQGAPIELVGKGVILRRTVESDARKVFEAIEESNEMLYPRMRWALPIPSFNKTVESCRDAESQWDRGDTLNYTIWTVADECLGRCSLHHIDWEVPKFEIGYWVRISGQGKGIATEATRLLTEMAFNTLSAKRVSLWCAVDNIGSRRVAEKLGFTHEGLFRNDEVDALGRAVDMDVFAKTSLLNP